MKPITASLDPDSFVKLVVTIWDVVLSSVEASFLPCPISRASYSSWMQIVKDSTAKNNYEIIGVIKTVDEDNLFAMLLIARKKQPSEEGIN